MITRTLWVSETFTVCKRMGLARRCIEAKPADLASSLILLAIQEYSKRTARAVLTWSGELELGDAVVREAVADMAEEIAAFGFGS
jgi:hypothetical protein